MQQRTATINRIRGLLSEFGIVLPLKAATVRREALHLLEDLPGWANTVIGYLLSEVGRLDERIAQYDRHIEQLARESAPTRQLMQTPGGGATTGTAGRDDHSARSSSAVPSSPLGWDWCRAKTAPAATSAWAASTRPAIRTCASS